MAIPRHERELRRAIDRLSELAIADVEAVWAELSPGERDRVRPLLAEANRVRAVEGAPATTAGASTGPEPATESDTAIARYLLGLGEAVATSVLASLEPAQRERVVGELPFELGRRLRSAASGLALTPAVRRSLRLATGEAARAADAQKPVPTNDEAGATEPWRWLRRWPGRRER